MVMSEAPNERSGPAGLIGLPRLRLYEGRTLMTNPRKVTVYCAEKGIPLERVAMDMRGGQGRSAEYLAKNPAGLVPLLELPDGSVIPESAAIIEYLEELHPDPPMLGVTPLERARTRALERIAGEFLSRNGTILANTHPFLPTHRPGYVQFPQAAQAFQGARDRALALLDVYIGTRPFLAGDRVTIPDCVLFAGLHVQTTLFDYQIPETAANVARWYREFSQRPSAVYAPPD